MNGVLRAMLEGVIDYAGLFPPAKLPMKAAVDEFVSITEGRDSWLVDRFACTAGRLDELLNELAGQEAAIPLAVIGTAPSASDQWKSSLERDGEAMARFQRAAAGRAEIQGFEIRVPDHRHVEDCVRDLRQFANIDIFVELPWAPEMTDSLALLAELESPCAKARTGGLDAAAFPSSAQLATFIQQCAQLDLSFKLTAGLHHPLPHADESTGGRMHGFLNVLIGTALTMAHDLSRKEIEEVLNDENPKAFQFKRDTLVWRDYRLTLEDVENSRTLFTSFGSCSVSEPLEGLEQMGLLEKVSR